MRTLTLHLLGLSLLALSANVIAGSQAAVDPKATGAKHRITYTSKLSFDSVKSALNEAFIERGLVINTTSHIGEMLERTGKDLGGAKQVFIKAEAYEFCSATVSRHTMEADPHNIVFCPYVILVYVLPTEPNKTYVSFRKPDRVGTAASKASLQEVEKLMRAIVEQALE